MTTTETALQAETNQFHHAQQLEVLNQTRDYTRRIHWWIRLVGVTWLTTIALSVLIGVGFVVAIAFAADSNSSPYSSRSKCIDAFGTTLAECNAWFGTD